MNNYVTDSTLRLLRDREEVVKLTQALVRIPSVYRPGDPEGNEQKVAQYVANYLKQMGVEVHIEEVEPGRPNVIGIIDSGKPGKRMRSHDLRSSMTGRSVGFQPGGQTVAQAAVRREQMVHPGIPVIPENSYLQPPKLERRSRYYQSKAWSHRLSRPLSQIGRAV